MEKITYSCDACEKSMKLYLLLRVNQFNEGDLDCDIEGSFEICFDCFKKTGIKHCEPVRR